MVTQENEIRPLVSVVMPAYKAAYLEDALDSVLAQTYRPLELVICDDCRGDEVRQVVDAFRARADFPVRYQHNEQRLNETHNLARCIELAYGEYVKPLYDDDLLHPDCVAQLLSAMQANPEVALASSRRQRIDELGMPLPDILATALPFSDDVLIDGAPLVSFLVDYTLNFIGEPSCVLLRRADVLEMGRMLTELNGLRIHWVGDLALYVKLLRQGRLAMLAQSLSSFRVSVEQFSQVGRNRPGIGEPWHEKFRQKVRELGWYEACEEPRLIAVAPLVDPAARAPVDLRELLAQAQTTAAAEQQLYDWLQARKPSQAQAQLIEQRLAGQGGGPTMAIIVLDRLGDAMPLRRTLCSLERVNTYRQVQVIPLRIAGQTNEHWVAALNEVLERSTADWVMLVEPGDLFTASGLRMIALELLGAPDCRALYADALQRDSRGVTGLLLRPDFNLDLLLSYPAGMSRHWLYRRDALLQAGAFDAAFAGALEFDLQLRLIEQGGLAGLGHVAEPLLICQAQPLEDNPAQRAALLRHLAARGYTQAQIASQWPGRYQLDYGHETQAGVSILLDAGDSLACLQRCVESLLAHTQGAYEILLLDRGNRGPLGDWLMAIAQIGEQQLRVLRYTSGTSYQIACNQAQGEARGELLLLLSANTVVLDDDWLAQLLNHAQRPEVGIVGARLLSPQGRIEHAGLLLGGLSQGQRPFHDETLDASGYMNRLQVEQNYAALSGDCLMVRRELFAELGGFDEGELGRRWADVDLCLRVRQAGLLGVWTPRVSLMLEASEALTPTSDEQSQLFERWLPQLADDPAYNPLFSQGRPFRLAELPLSWRPLSSWRPLPVALAFIADSFGCGHYRVIQPFQAQQNAGLLDGTLATSLMPPEDVQRLDPDVLLFQRQVSAPQLEHMARLKRFSHAFKVYELDDYLPNLPLKNLHREHMPRDILKSLRRGLGLVDRFVVSTEALAEAFAGLHSDIRVVANRLPPQWWDGLRGQRVRGGKPRVGWAGGSGHTGDLALIADVVRELADEVEWVFFGMCPDNIRPYVHEFHPGVGIERYPAALARLNLDLALAPVEQNLFNECKSNLRLLEYGACGFPVICSDIRCYQGDGLPVTRVKNRFKDWVDAIRMHLSDLDASAHLGDELQAQVRRDWMLEGGNLEAWRKAWLPD
nr:glycosyltransferase [Pseudomonas mendocina]